MAIWTVAYQAVLLLRWPAWTVLLLFILFVAAFVWVVRRCDRGKGHWLWAYDYHSVHLWLFGMGGLCGVTVLFLLRPNQDDVVYFHRALIQVSHLTEPLFTRQTSVDMDAAAFSPVHLATSHELLMALLGHFLGISPVYTYQVIGHVAAAFSIPFVFYFCVRCYGFGRRAAGWGAAAALFFLLIDSAGPASFGHTVVCRLWQGKAIVWILFLPLACSLSFRFLRQGRAGDVFGLTCLAIAGVGLSNSALYLVPAAVGCASWAALALATLTRQKTWRTCFKRCWILATPIIYPVAILLLLAVNIIPKPIDLRGFGPAVIPWTKGIYYVVGLPRDFWREVAMIIVIPLGVVQGRRGSFLFFYLVIVALLCLNPLLDRFWMSSITASCYFRLVYLMPLPLLAALLPAAFVKSYPSASFDTPRLVRFGAVAFVVLFCVLNFRKVTVAPRSSLLSWKSPLADQFLPANVAFAREADPLIAHSKLLAPNWTASCELPLLFPKMKIVAPRLCTHYFANAGNWKEGILRRQAQAFVEGENAVTPQREGALSAAFKKVIVTNRANAIAVPVAQGKRVLAVLQSIDPRWHRVLEAGGLVLMLPGKAPPGQTAPAG
ncbi:MAG: DUF6077 domain-containing protein [Chthoniobacterales bacterium]